MFQPQQVAWRARGEIDMEIEMMDLTEPDEKPLIQFSSSTSKTHKSPDSLAGADANNPKAEPFSHDAALQVEPSSQPELEDSEAQNVSPPLTNTHLRQRLNIRRSQFINKTPEFRRHPHRQRDR